MPPISEEDTLSDNRTQAHENTTTKPDSNQTESEDEKREIASLWQRIKGPYLPFLPIPLISNISQIASPQLSPLHRIAALLSQ